MLFPCSFCSYNDTEQYEDAVRDYEKIYNMDKTRGMHRVITQHLDGSNKNHIQ